MIVVKKSFTLIEFLARDRQSVALRLIRVIGKYSKVHRIWFHAKCDKVLDRSRSRSRVKIRLHIITSTRLIGGAVTE